MKKILFALVALLPLLVSCGKESTGGNSFEEPRFAQYARMFIPQNANIAIPVSLTKAEDLSGILLSIEFTESGIYVIGRLVDGKPEYIAGTYNTVDGSVFTLSDFGTVELGGSSDHPTVTVKYQSGLSKTFPAIVKKASGTNVAYRGWTIDRTRVTVNGFHAPASADFKGCNFDEMAKFLNDNGHKGGYLPSGSLKSVSITGANSFIFVYSDGSADVAEYTFSGSSFSFSWKSGNRVLEVSDGKATIDYLDGKCILKIDAALKGSTTTGTVTFVMSPMV